MSPPYFIMRKEILIWLLGVLLVIVVGYGYAQQRNIMVRYREFDKNEEQIEAVKQDIESLKQRVTQAQQRVKAMKADPIEIEATIRRVRRLTRDGEIVFRIEEPLAVIESHTSSP
ncbi:MAG: septum formation initiator family protein [Candidatus Hydrogenedentes bacterium]|nr:septum formation initiator family protein [Candidatus Hydrogenedentota bacterium]